MGRAWSASYRLGERLVVALSDGDDDKESRIGADATVVRVSRGESVYPKLMAALVQSGIVRIVV